MPSIPSIIPLSSAGSGNLMIKVVATGTLGTLIHTAVAGLTNYHEIHLWAVNSDTTDRKLTLEWGGATVPDCLIEKTIPAEDGPYYIIPGLMLNNGLTVRAFAATANVIMITGWAKLWTIT